MTLPSRQLVLLTLLPCVLTLCLIFEPALWIVVVTVDGLLLGIAFADFWTVPRFNRLNARRDCDTLCSLGERHRVRLFIENRTRRSLEIEVRDDQLSHFEFDPPELTVQVPPRSRVETHYMMVPMRRGTFQMEAVYLRTASRLNLWRRIYRKSVLTQIRVYPDLKQISRYALYARTNRLNLLGVRKARRVGTDNEFERLREYSHDDNYKFIDWRATGRRRKLIVRDFQSNQSQRLVFMIDCGRMMVNEAEGGLSLLDHSLDAMLMLTHVALTRGDQVGLLTFSDRIHQWVPLGGTARHQNRIVHAVHDLYPSLVESRYDSAFMYLNRHCRKRTLVVLITNLIDDVNARQVESQLSNLTGRHLPLAVFLRDRDLFAAATPSRDNADRRYEFPDETSFYQAAAAADILDWRAQVLQELRHQGVLTLDVFPEHLTAPIINEYLRIKAQHLL